MTVGKTDEIKQELARKVESTKAGTKLKKSMSIADMIKVMEPQIKKALPEVITPERFTRMALSALNTTPTNYESMALKTIIKKALKYAPLKSEFRNALSTDETIKNEIGADMSEINGENIFDTVYQEECA